ncbi:hypothetical protein [Micromonospora sp. NPDC007230]|uniref:hypothetical protein n=1 Tax=Micromonospora sp. NPDC007230 TaxID=3364237 RepID=UPI0036AC5274
MTKFGGSRQNWDSGGKVWDRAAAAVIGAVAVAVATALPAAPASAKVSAEEPVTEVIEFGAEEVDTVARPGPDGKWRGRDRMDSYLDDQARDGRLVDDAIVRYGSLPDPFREDEKVDIVWEGENSPEKITYGERSQDGEKVTGLGVEFQPDETADAAEVAPSSGYNTAFNYSNMARRSNGCTTSWFKPGYWSSWDHKIVSCYEKFQQTNGGSTGQKHWIYNRWALWTPAPVSYADERRYTTDMYVASRPWKTTASRVASLNKWIPPAMTESCSTLVNLEIGGTYGGATGKITIPINKCKEFLQRPNTTSRTIAMDLYVDGQGKRTGDAQLRMDHAGDFTSSGSTVTPSWADYNYVEVQWCTFFGAACDPPTAFAAKDSGW